MKFKVIAIPDDDRQVEMGGRAGMPEIPDKFEYEVSDGKLLPLIKGDEVMLPPSTTPFREIDAEVEDALGLEVMYDDS